jgi:sporulation protein YlmC with PRC-barrel domain
MKRETKRKASIMNKRRNYLTASLAGLVCLTLVPATQAADDVKTPMARTIQKADSDPNSTGQVMEPTEMPAHASHEMSTEPASSEVTPTKVNKASGILGMDVRNQNHEHLGHVKDLVIDWKSEQVSYAVISTAPKALLGISEKLLAVPLTALLPSEDQKYLILNADKSKVEAALGIDRDKWPSVSKPVWGAQPFWQTDTEKTPRTGQPPKTSDTNAMPNAIPDPKSDMEPSTDPEPKPDVEPDSDIPAKPDMGQEP